MRKKKGEETRREQRRKKRKDEENVQILFNHSTHELYSFHSNEMHILVFSLKKLLNEVDQFPSTSQLQLKLFKDLGFS